MKKYNLIGIENYFTKIGHLGLSDVSLSLIEDDYHEEDFENDIYENCDTREDAEKWAKRYVSFNGLVFDIPTVIQCIIDSLECEKEVINDVLEDFNS